MAIGMPSWPLLRGQIPPIGEHFQDEVTSSTPAHRQCTFPGLWVSRPEEWNLHTDITVSFTVMLIQYMLIKTHTHTPASAPNCSVPFLWLIPSSWAGRRDAASSAASTVHPKHTHTHQLFLLHFRLKIFLYIHTHIHTGGCLEVSHTHVHRGDAATQCFSSCRNKF